MYLRPDVRSAKHDIHRRSQIVGNDDLLEHSDGYEAQADSKIDRVQAQEALGLDLRIEFAEIGDRADNQLRKEADKGAIPEEGRANRSDRVQLAEKLRDVLIARISVGQECRALKGVERNTSRDRNARDVDHDASTGAEYDRYDLILEVAQRNDVVGLPREIDPFPVLAIILQKSDRNRYEEVHDQRQHQKNGRGHAVGNVEDYGGYEDNGESGILAMKIGNRVERDQRKRQEYEEEKRIGKYQARSSLSQPLSKIRCAAWPSGVSRKCL